MPDVPDVVWSIDKHDRVAWKEKLTEPPVISGRDGLAHLMNVPLTWTVWGDGSSVTPGE
jgi:hypothetical protein